MRKLSLVASCIVVGAAGLSAMGQDAPRRGNRPDGERPAERGGQPGERRGMGGGMQQLSPEKAKAAWELAATGVAKRLGLNEEQTKGVVKAYVDARTSQGAAQQKMRDEMMRSRENDEGGDMRARGEEMMKKMDEMNKSEREKLTKALSDAVGPETAGSAAASLGLFAPNWDRMVDALGEFKLEAKKQQDALNAVETFIVAQSKMGRDMEREERQEAMRTNREKLLGALKPVLSEEQMKKFEQSTGPGRGRGGEGGGGGGGGRRGGGGGGGGGF